jgi:hypothetical protein
VRGRGSGEVVGIPDPSELAHVVRPWAGRDSADSRQGRILREEREAKRSGNLWRTGDVQAIACLVFARSRIYAARVTMTKSPRRQQEERLARILLWVMAGLIPFLAALIFWMVGLDVHPHRLVYAGVITGCAVVWGVASTWLFYWARMKSARKM